MSKRRKEHQIDYVELAKAAHTFPSAWEALKRYNLIREGGGLPVIYLSEQNGYRVVDDLAIRLPPPK